LFGEKDFKVGEHIELLSIEDGNGDCLIIKDATIDKVAVDYIRVRYENNTNMAMIKYEAIIRVLTNSKSKRNPRNWIMYLLSTTALILLLIKLIGEIK
jgi:hypothetical protein